MDCCWAALAALETATANAMPEARRLLEREYGARLAPDNGERTAATGLAPLRREALVAERLRLAALRREERIGDGTFPQLEEELDGAEAGNNSPGR